MVNKPFQIGNPSDPSYDLTTVKSIIDSYENHPIIIKIKENIGKNLSFSLRSATKTEINDILKGLDTNKSTGIDDIPAKFVKIAADILDEPMNHIINKSIKDCKFYDDAKIAVIPPIFKKDDRTLKENVRPVSILNVFSKVFETYLKNIIQPYCDKILSLYQLTGKTMKLPMSY